MPFVVLFTFSNSLLKSSVSVGVWATYDVTLLKRALKDRAYPTRLLYTSSSGLRLRVGPSSRISLMISLIFETYSSSDA